VFRKSAGRGRSDGIRGAWTLAIGEGIEHGSVRNGTINVKFTSGLTRCSPSEPTTIRSMYDLFRNNISSNIHIGLTTYSVEITGMNARANRTALIRAWSQNSPERRL
jgi:hypothetical protein